MFRNSRWYHLALVVFLVLASLLVPEPQLVLANTTYTVTTTSDALSGNCTAEPTNCSLRQAINSANSDGTASTILFSIPGGATDLRIITLSSVLPTISANDLTITGSTNTLGLPNVVIDGGGNLNYGLRITSANNTIQRLIINNFRSTTAPNGVGIWITGAGASGNRIFSSYIGNRPLDTTRYTNTRGIQVDAGAANTIIGGDIDNTTQRNTISGNNLSGIYVFGASNTQIRGNYIGLALGAGGTLAALGNTGPGVEVVDSSSTAIGGATLGQRNLIGANGDGPTTGAGVLISGDATTGTQVIGNYIGTSADGFSAIGNNGDGVRLQDGARNTTISSGQDRALISGNTGFGVRIAGDSTSGTQITNAYIGMDRNGSAALANGLGGVRIEDAATNNTVGPGNVIAGNSGYGISVGLTLPTATQVVSQTIIGSIIGLNATGNAAFPNTAGGILLGPGSRQVRIGGVIASERNTISGNTGYGIRITGSRDNAIIGNHIGVDPGATTTFANSQGGILIENGSQQNTVGGTRSSEQNIIAGNAGPGVAINGSNTLTTTVSFNLIGLRRPTSGSSNLVAASNSSHGVWVASGPRNTTVQRNSIGANGGTGILIEGIGTITTTVQSNQVGAVASGSNLLQFSNTGNGIAVRNGVRATSVTTNTIGFNGGNGILVADSTSTIIRAGSVLTNAVGISVTNSLSTTIQSLTVQGNTQGGIEVGGASRFAPITQNTIRNNGVVGVRVTGTAQRVRITDNTITANGGQGQGIRLLPSNPSGGVATNPNHDIDPPSSLRLNQNRQLTGRVRVQPGNPGSCITCTIQIFTTDPGLLDRQGRTLILTIEPTSIDASGAFTVTLPQNLGLPRQLALTATDFNDNTSEFAHFDTRISLAIGPPRAQSASPGETITYVHQITNTGSIGFTDLRLSVNSQQGWTNAITPTGTISLGAGESRPVTLTLTLPSGSAPNVRAGLQERTRVTIASTAVTTATASVTDTTTVLPRFVLAVSPTARSGSGKPNTQVSYVHTLTNNGNITRTVTLVANTNLGSLWETSVSPNSIELGPGRSADTTVRVRVPIDAQVPLTATTTVQINVPSPDQAQSRVVTDTTSVALEQAATMYPDQQDFAAAGATITFRHTVENLSNGSATFRLVAGSSLGSRVRFRSNTPGVVLSNGNTFTIGNEEGDNRFEFFVDVTVEQRALPGQTDLITISLTDTAGNAIGGASVQDRIIIASGQVLPRIFQSLVLR